MAQRLQQLAHLEYLGDAAKFAGQIQALIPKCTLLEHFSLSEVSTLAHFMDVYRAVPARESLARIIVEQPLLGAKILMELVLMLSQRLRATSARLLGLLDEQQAGGAPPPHLLRC